MRKIFFIFVVSTLFLGIFVKMVSKTYAGTPLEDQLDVSIIMNIKWEKVPDKGVNKEEGSCFIQVSGKVVKFEKEKKRRSRKITSIAKEEINYFPQEGMSVTYKFNNKYYDRDSLLCAEEEGFGSKQVKGKDAQSGDSAFALVVMLGNAGKGIALQLCGDKDRILEKMFKLREEPPNDNYMFLFNVPFPTTVKKYNKGCSIRQPGGKVFALNTVIKKLDEGGMHGSFNWNVERADDYQIAAIKECGGVLSFTDPSPGWTYNVRYNVTWQFGKVRPIVKIWRHYKDRKPQDITDAKPMKVPVIVGEKVILEAETLPSGTEVTNGEWKIDDKKVIAGYKANAQKGKVLNLTKEDCKKKKIEFYWTDGSFSGIPENITYSADSKKGKVEGKTIITVFEPSVRMEVKSKPPHIDLWPVDKEEVKNPVCRLYLGDRSKLPKEPIPDGKAEDLNKKAARDAAGIFIDSTITLPMPFSNQEHSLEYIQLIKELILETWDVKNICTRADNWLCDKNYPYANKVAEKTIYMDDSPGSPLSIQTHLLNQYQTFQTFLMFRPCPLSKAQSDENSVWVPLRVVEWEWKASAKRIKEFSNYDYALPEEFRRTDLIIPSPKEKEWKGPPESYPQWDGNVEPEEDRRKKINQTGDRDQTRWRELLDEFAKIESSKTKTKSKK